jgi:hypothetical protein
MNGDERKTASTAEEKPESNSKFSIQLDVYKNCFIDYVKAIGPFASPFAFLSYGISYPEMLNGIRQYPAFLNFIILFIMESEKPSEYNKAMDVLNDAGITAEELRKKLQEVTL